jgi:hypothetical protein
MAGPQTHGPPDEVRYELDAALSLLADLEDARDALIASARLAVVVSVEHQIRELSRRLHLDDEGNSDGE